MITREQLVSALDGKKPFQNRNIDHDVTVISLLRSRIPYDVCKGIISGADHDILYLCDVDIVLEYLEESDIEVLAESNVMIHDAEYLALFV